MQRIIFILGPTASGKSELALALARSRGAAILALDSMQIYRGADIGTGKPNAAERAEIVHGGIDLADIGGDFNVAAYRKHAEAFLAQTANFKTVLIVGGTGLYYRVLTRGFSQAPPVPDGLRVELDALSVDALRERLRRVDPAILEHLDASNPRRLSRAIGVMESTGRSLLDWQKETIPPLLAYFSSYILQRERDDLHTRIERRIDAMLAAGWVGEVERLIATHGIEALAQFPAIGYRELVAWLQSGGNFETVRQQIVFATRQYARRQLTWFRREPNLEVLKVSRSVSPATVESQVA